MTELPLIFLGGLLGSSHCIGMCGPLALALGVQTISRLKRICRRQLVFSAGRIFTYGFRRSGWPRSADGGSRSGRIALINVQARCRSWPALTLIWLGLSTAGCAAATLRTLAHDTAVHRRQMVQDPADRTGDHQRAAGWRLHRFHSMRTGLRLSRLRGQHGRRPARLADDGRVRAGHGAADGACRLRRHLA